MVVNDKGQEIYTEAEIEEMSKIGYVLWRGPSQLDGIEIVVIVTGFKASPSKNIKTGKMLQVWILRVDVAPNVAKKDGRDFTVCGNCTHRINKTCYVVVHNAPLSVWRAYNRNRYQFLDKSDYSTVLAGYKIRWGSYGDPSLIPADIVRDASAACVDWTGYTHQWREAFASEFKGFFQASCDAPAHIIQANDDGWSTFTVLPEDYDYRELPVKASVCPASINDNIQCIDCLQCNGACKRIRNKVIQVHGKAGIVQKYAFAAD